MGHAELEAMAQSGDRGASIAILDAPGPLTDYRDLALGGTECMPLHAILL
jgi:hypothetical protein